MRLYSFRMKQGGHQYENMGVHTMNLNKLRGILLDIVLRQSPQIQGLNLRGADEPQNVRLRFYDVQINEERYRLGEPDMVPVSVTVGLCAPAPTDDGSGDEETVQAMIQALNGFFAGLPVHFVWPGSEGRLIDEADWRYGSYGGAKLALSAQELETGNLTFTDLVSSSELK